jgi:hypothetical protein
MSTTRPPLPPLALSQTNGVGRVAFEGDLFEREILAQKLTAFVDRLKEGAVVAIDAPWGSGKTWFGRNWKMHLEGLGHQVVFVDAFQQDYVDDPFLLVAAELTQMFRANSTPTEKLQKNAGAVLKALLPLGAKYAANFAGRVALGTADITSEINDTLEAINDEGADKAEEWIKRRFDDYAKEKSSLVSFKTELSRIAEAQTKPVVIFIDELDRCRPTFAVQLVERLKHLFDVPNLVFVLLLNRQQLEGAVRGVYGSETKADAYLSKFVNFYLRLPQRHSFGYVPNDHTQIYISHLIDRYGIRRDEDMEDFIDLFKNLAIGYGLSLRDLERAVALYAFAQPIPTSNQVITYLIVLKVSQPNLFERLRRGELKAHLEARELSSEIHNHMFSISNERSKFFEAIYRWHDALQRDPHNVDKEVEELMMKYVQPAWRMDRGLTRLFEKLASRIDLAIEG